MNVRITIEPWRVSGMDIVRIEVKYAGTHCTYERPIAFEDLTSRFDQLFDVAREHLREAIKADLKAKQEATLRA